MDGANKLLPEANAPATSAGSRTVTTAEPRIMHIIGFDSMPALVSRMNDEEKRTDVDVHVISSVFDPQINGFCAVVRAPVSYKPLFAGEAKMMMPESKLVLPS